MNIKDIIKSEIISRANAARELRDGLRINDIDICAGCDDKGIQIYSGIEKVAEIMGEQLHEDVYDSGEYAVNELWFDYGTDDDDTVRFFQVHYTKMKPEKKTEDKTGWDK